jgi:hypothetical protein
LLTWSRAVEVGGSRRPLEGGDVVTGRVEGVVGLAGVDPAPAGGRVVEGVELGREVLRPPRVIDVHPHRDGVDERLITEDRDAPLGPATAVARAERGQLEALPLSGRAPLLDDGAPHDPGHRIGQASVVGVVAGDVLEVAGEGVEAEVPARIDVAAPDPAARLEHPSLDRDGQEVVARVGATVGVGGWHRGDATGASTAARGPSGRGRAPLRRSPG